MSLTPAQITTLRADLAANPAVQQFIADRREDLIADFYNATASPAFVVWRKGINSAEIGPVLNYAAVAALTTANRDRATTFLMLNQGTFNAGADIALYWDTTFAGALDGQGANTRAALQALWRRTVNRLERLFVTGTGSDAVPGSTPFQNAPTVTPGYIRAVLDGGV